MKLGFRIAFYIWLQYKAKRVSEWAARKADAMYDKYFGKEEADGQS